MKTSLLLLVLLVLLSLGLTAHAVQQDKAPAHEIAAKRKADAALVAAQLPSYPLDTCVVSGETLGSMGDPIEHVQDGRLVRLCCKGCVKTVEKDPQSVLKKIDRAVVLAQKPIYPLDTCVVSGEELGSMGDPVEHVVGTRLVRLCCGGCVASIEKDPPMHLAKVDAALVEALRPSYPLETCVISGEKLGSMGPPIDRLYGVQLVRLCCEGCLKAFEKDPQGALAKVAEAKKAQ